MKPPRLDFATKYGRKEESPSTKNTKYQSILMSHLKLEFATKVWPNWSSCCACGFYLEGLIVFNKTRVPLSALHLYSSIEDTPGIFAVCDRRRCQMQASGKFTQQVRRQCDKWEYATKKQNIHTKLPVAREARAWLSATRTRIDVSANWSETDRQQPRLVEGQ